jgi:nitrate/TMAO reductase-like tetraheme cytochrome c subunit
METSMFTSPLALICLSTAAIAAALLLYYLARKPPLHTATKLLLLAGLGVFPLLSAGSGSYAGFEHTKARAFCNGCHVMEPWIDDAEDPTSNSLSAMHARNELFGDQSCYTCHADYGMFGTIATKVTGLKHVAGYVLEYHDMPIEEAVEKIRLFEPFPNENCTRCHSTTLPGYGQVPDHAAMKDPAEASCASHGCHGPAHPFAGGSRE